MIEVGATTAGPLETDADTVVVGLYEGKGIAHDVGDGVLGALVEAGEARPKPAALAVTHFEGRRFIVVGLGPRGDAWTPDRAREVAAAVHGRAKELGARHVCWEAPHHSPDPAVAALVSGTLLHAYAYDRYKHRGEGERGALQRLTVSAHHDVGDVVERAVIVARAQNRARDLQNAPPNECTPRALARRARELGPGLDVEVLEGDEIAGAGMGAFAAVAQGSAEPPCLIAVRHEPAGATGDLLALVGKGVTFDSGGYSIKTRKSLPGEKFDMSGAAAVLEAVGAIAELGLPVRVLGVVGTCENLVSGTAVRPGDIVRALDGTTIEVDNTDAEGRLVLADCLAWALGQGAERLVDIATLTGGVVTALGDAYAGLMGTDEAWVAEVQAAAEAADEPAWRLPLHRRYHDVMKGRYADLRNSTLESKAHAVTAAAFLSRFVAGRPWAHLDIAGVASDTGRPWARHGGTGWGVRTLVELAALRS
ncbi:MAG TPA: leucyl aminopeptidase, partial [Solirubrobacteraceae bacterium]